MRGRRSRSHLAGDPFAFAYALNYCTRKKEVRKRLSAFTESDFQLALKNLIWVWRRALIVLQNPQTDADAVPIWRLKTIPDVCEYCLTHVLGRNITHLCRCCRIVHTQIGRSTYKEAIVNLIENADEVQYMMYGERKVDIYKKLKNYKFLDEKPEGVEEPLEDIFKL